METLLVLLAKSCLCIAIVSGVPLILSSTVGLFVALFQATTQIQEQGLMYLSKLVTISCIIIFAGRYFLQLIISLFRDVISSLTIFGIMS